MEKNRKREEELLNQELEKLDRQISGMGPGERAARVSSMRQMLLAHGLELTIYDEKLLKRFVGGEAQFDDLVAHFKGRV